MGRKQSDVSDSIGPSNKRAASGYFGLVIHLIASLLLVPPSFAALERTVLAEMRAQHVPGVQVAIVKDGRLVYDRAFGVASVETREKLTPETVFKIASTTKMYTAAAVAKAAGGRLDEPISKILPTLQEDVGRLTLRQLLSHTSGFLDTSPAEGSQDEDTMLASASTYGKQSFFTEPGEVYSYANPDYELAGMLLSKMTGKRYADAVGDALFMPLDMTRTTFRPTMAMTYPLAVGHAYDEETKGLHVVRPLTNNVLRWPSGGIFTTADQMTHFCAMLMDGGRWNGKQVLSPDVVKEMLTPNPKTRIGDATRWYSLGLNIVEERGLTFVQHAGGTDGYGSVVRMVPSLHLAIVMLMNATNANLPKSYDAAVEAFQKLAPEPAELAPQPWTAEDLQRFAGTYKNGNLVFEVLAKDGGLVLNTGDEDLRVTKLNDHLLSLKHGNPSLAVSILAVDLPVTFGPDGRPKYLHFVGRALRRQ